MIQGHMGNNSRCQHLTSGLPGLDTIHIATMFYCLSNLQIPKCALILNKRLEPTCGLVEENAYVFHTTLSTILKVSSILGPA
jgi:hypothetical protein